MTGHVRVAGITAPVKAHRTLPVPCRAGRADCWIKVKNPAASAVMREAEEEWN
jgi:hypothetical protein